MASVVVGLRRLALVTPDAVDDHGVARVALLEYDKRLVVGKRLVVDLA
jgi:hypothetical protein